MDRGDEEIKLMRQAMEESLGSEKGVLTGMIPRLERILGDAESCGNRREQTAIRFNYALRASLRSICSKDKHCSRFCSMKSIARSRETRDRPLISDTLGLVRVE